jgi:hypothetical protein
MVDLHNFDWSVDVVLAADGAECRAGSFTAVSARSHQSRIKGRDSQVDGLSRNGFQPCRGALSFDFLGNQRHRGARPAQKTLLDATTKLRVDPIGIQSTR